MREVKIEAIPLDRLTPLLDPERVERLGQYAERARALLEDRIVWNVNATATGGGVAEMLQALLAYSRGAGVDTRWLVLEAGPDFFALTKRIHNLLHGAVGDGGPTGAAEAAAYDAVMDDQLQELRALGSPGEIVVLHDPQTAGLAAGLRDHGAHVVWRCHVGRDTTNAVTDRAWAFLRPYVEAAEATIFTRRAYVPDWTCQDWGWLIPPSLDPFSPKYRTLASSDMEAPLRHPRIVPFPDDGGSL